VWVDPSFSAKLPTVARQTPFKPEANASRVGVGVLRNEPALKEQSFVAPECEQDRRDFGLASLFDCGKWHNTFADGCDLKEPKVDSVILQNNTVSFNAEAPVSFVTAELSSLKYVDI